ncbi:MAG: hypothetical protein ABIT04_07930 [Novosphingobium sp.]
MPRAFQIPPEQVRLAAVRRYLELAGAIEHGARNRAKFVDKRAGFRPARLRRAGEFIDRSLHPSELRKDRFVAVLELSVRDQTLVADLFQPPQRHRLPGGNTLLD